jgi:hypothetical protein
MLHILILALLFSEAAKFEGIWKSDLKGKTYAIVTILSDHPPRGTMARGEAAAELFIQDPKIVKGALRFKTIDPNDGVIQYEMKVTSPSEATLSIAGRESVTLKRN